MTVLASKSGLPQRQIDKRRPPPTITVGNVRRQIDPDQEYVALVYEFVPEGEKNPEATQSALDFFWLAGFDYIQTPRWDNWADGVLLDLAEIMHPFAYMRNRKHHGRKWVKDLK